MIWGENCVNVSIEIQKSFAAFISWRGAQGRIPRQWKGSVQLENCRIADSYEYSMDTRN